VSKISLCMHDEPLTLEIRPYISHDHQRWVHRVRWQQLEEVLGFDSRHFDLKETRQYFTYSRWLRSDVGTATAVVHLGYVWRVRIDCGEEITFIVFLASSPVMRQKLGLVIGKVVRVEGEWIFFEATEPLDAVFSGHTKLSDALLEEHPAGRARK
jgi:hypothetical protein